MRYFVVFFAMTAGLMTLSGCSNSADSEPHKVKDLKSRGMKDPSKDDMKPAKGELPGAKKPQG